MVLPKKLVTNANPGLRLFVTYQGMFWSLNGNVTTLHEGSAVKILAFSHVLCSPLTIRPTKHLNATLARCGP